MLIKRTLSNIMHTINVRQELPALVGLDMLDFVFHLDGKLVGVEGRGPAFSNQLLQFLARDIKESVMPLDCLILVTEEPPDDFQNKNFMKIFSTRRKRNSDAMSEIEYKWLGLSEFIDWLGLNWELDSNNFSQMERMREAGIGSSLRRYWTPSGIISMQSPVSRKELGALDLGKIVEEAHLVVDAIPRRLLSTRNNLSDAVLARILECVIGNSEDEYLETDVKIEDIFCVGSEIESAVILIADIVNSSSITKGSPPNSHSLIMYEYCRKARDLAWHFDGYLDKFTGDGLCVIFNYPFNGTQPVKNALMFSKALIELGRALFQNLKYELNDDIVSGTRIGITLGPLRVMDLGLADTEYTFVGDTYNRAARLEANSEIDGVLIDHRSFVRLDEEDMDFCEALSPKEKFLDAVEAKGQNQRQKCWNISAEALSKIKLSR